MPHDNAFAATTVYDNPFMPGFRSECMPQDLWDDETPDAAPARHRAGPWPLLQLALPVMASVLGLWVLAA